MGKLSSCWVIVKAANTVVLAALGIDWGRGSQSVVLALA